MYLIWWLSGPLLLNGLSDCHNKYSALPQVSRVCCWCSPSSQGFSLQWVFRFSGFPVFLSPQKPTSPSSISARIDDPLENQLKFVIFIVKIYCITSVLRLALMAVEADRGDVKRFMLVDVIPVGVFRDPSVFPFTFLGSETLKFHFGLSLRRVEEVRKVGGGGGEGLTRSTSAALPTTKPSTSLIFRD